MKMKMGIEYSDQFSIQLRDRRGCPNQVSSIWYSSEQDNLNGPRAFLKWQLRGLGKARQDVVSDHATTVTSNAPLEAVQQW